MNINLKLLLLLWSTAWECEMCKTSRLWWSNNSVSGGNFGNSEWMYLLLDIWKVYSDNRLYMWVVKTSMWVENCFYFLLLCSFVVLFMRCALLTSYGSVRVILILLTSMLILASLRPFYCLSVRYKVGCILTKHEFNWDVLYLVSAVHLFWQICRRWNEVLICIKSTIQRNWYFLWWHE